MTAAVCKFTFIEDPGHAWLMVHKDVARQVGYAPTVAAYKAHHTGREVIFDSKYQERFRDMVSPARLPE